MATGDRPEGTDGADRSGPPATRRRRSRLQQAVGWGLVLVAVGFVAVGFVLVLLMLRLWGGGGGFLE